MHASQTEQPIGDYSLEVYTHPKDFPEDVMELFSKLEQENLESGAGWYGNFVDTVAKKIGESFFYVLRRNSRPIAALPLLKIRKRPSYVSFHSLSNYYTSFYAPLIDSTATQSDITILLKKILQQNAKIHCFQLEPLDFKARTTDILLLSLRESGFICFEYFCFKNLFLTVQKNWTDYLASRGHRILNTLKRKAKKLINAGGALEIVTTKSQLEPALADYLQVYRASWKKPEPFPDFIPGLVRTYAANGWIRIGVARLQGRPIAAQIWIIKDSCASIFKLAYDDEYKTYSAGTQLTAQLLRQAIEVENVKTVDYMKGDELHKRDWMNNSCDRIGILAINPRTMIGISLLIKESSGRALKAIFWGIKNFSKYIQGHSKFST